MKRAALDRATAKARKGKFAVEIIESESGWGERIDETMWFDSLEMADRFVRDYNRHNNKPHVPDWYMYARHRKSK